MNGRDLGLLFGGFVIGVATGLMFREKKQMNEVTPKEFFDVAKKSGGEAAVTMKFTPFQSKSNEEPTKKESEIADLCDQEKYVQALSQMIKSLETRLKWEYRDHFQSQEYWSLHNDEELTYAYLKRRKEDGLIALSDIEEKALSLLEEFNAKRVHRQQEK
jgi:hypothetical protein